MEKKLLSGLEVTRLGFGALPLGPLQANLSIKKGSDVIFYAISSGINFIDTAEVYGTYHHIKKAKEKIKNKIIIATKSFASDYFLMEESIKKALKELDVECIDIFHLHAPREDESVFKKRKEALKCLIDYKEKGKILKIGISTHSVRTVKASAKNKYIDIIHPLINKKGMGIIHGNVKEMLSAIKFAKDKGKGIYAMKVLAGGNLLDEYPDAIEFVVRNPDIDAVVIGMVTKKEVEFNINFFKTGIADLQKLKKLQKKKRLSIIKKFCKGCGRCANICPNNALSIVDGKAEVDRTKCILCGYCADSCPDFFIRLV